MTTMPIMLDIPIPHESMPLQPVPPQPATPPTDAPAPAVADSPADANPQAETADEPVAHRSERASQQAARYRVQRNEARHQLAALEIQFAQEREALLAQHTAEITALQTQLAEAQAQAQREQVGRWRLEAVAQTGLPVALAERLRGDTLEALAHDATQLAELFTARSNGRLAHSTAPAPSRAQQIVARIEGRQENPFGVLRQKALGGI